MKGHSVYNVRGGEGDFFYLSLFLDLRPLITTRRFYEETQPNPLSFTYFFFFLPRDT